MIGPDSRIYVAGHRGLVGSAVARALAAAGHRGVFGRASDELDLRDPAAVAEFLRRERPDAVVMAAGRVGGVRANAADGYGFFRDNLLMAVADVEGARAAGVRRLLYLGSSCAYPRDAAQPFREESLFCGADFEPKPLRVTVAAAPVGCGSAETLATAHVTLFDFGAVSVRLDLPLAGTAEGLVALSRTLVGHAALRTSAELHHIAPSGISVRHRIRSAGPE